MRLPSGTRMSLLLVFGFLLITTEFPEFTRFRPSRGKLMNMLMPIGDGELIDGDYDGYLGGGDLTETGDIGRRTSILVEAWGFKKFRYRKWGCGGCGGYRRMYYGGYHRRGWGCNVCGKRKRK